MSHRPGALIRRLVALACLSAVPVAQAALVSSDAYFIRPFVQSSSALQDGLDVGGQTFGAVDIGGGEQFAEVDLANGTTRNRAHVSGAGQFAISAGVMGDRLTLQGGPGNIDFHFNIDGSAITDAGRTGGPLAIQIVANLRVFDPSAGATYANFAGLAGALVSDTFLLNLDVQADAIDETINQALFGSLAFGGGLQAIDVFASLSIAIATNDNPLDVRLDFSHTGRLGVEPAASISFDSASGVFPGSLAPPMSVPEPASWALTLAALAIVRRTSSRR
jgi:hypothetical protein